MSTPAGPVHPPTRMRVVGTRASRRHALDAIDGCREDPVWASVRVDELDVPSTDRGWDAVLAGRVDLVLIVTDGAGPIDPAELADMMTVLQRDATTAAVGATPMLSPTGALELAVSGAVLLARAGALRAIGGLDGSTLTPLYDLRLSTALWVVGHRVRSSGHVRALVGQEASGAEIRAGVLGAVAAVLEEVDLPTARARGAGELAPMLRRWVDRWVAAGGPRVAAEAVSEAVGEARGGTRRRILVLTADVIAPQMAGPAIRAVAIARALREEHEVRLRSTAGCDLVDGDLDLGMVGERELRTNADWADVILFQGWVIAGRRWLRDSHKILIADAYDPMHLEQLEQGIDAPGERGHVDVVRGAAAVLNEQLRRADLVLCAGPRQRDFWLGALATLGRVNPVTYGDDPTLEDLVADVPFGVSDEPLPALPGAIKGVIPGIGPGDPVILWGGGVYNWFDPLTLVRAVDQLRHEIPNVRLVFMGMVHPNPAIPTMRMAVDLRELSAALGLTGTHVFFNEGWVPWGERAAYLGDADVAVSTHLDHVETAFSFRTRILDYLWAGLPIVATRGDAFASLLERSGAGLTVPPGDVAALAEALSRSLQDSEVRSAAAAGSAALREELAWARVLEPLLTFCREPHRAPDVACPNLDPSPEGFALDYGVRRDLRVAVDYLRTGGLGLLVNRARARVGRLRDERRSR